MYSWFKPLTAKVEIYLDSLSTLLTPKRILVYALALFVILWSGLLIIHVRAKQSSLTPAIDFLALYTAAQIARDNPDRLYDVALQRDIQHNLVPGLPPAKHWHYLYPPFFTILLLPYSLLSYLQAYWLWTAMSLVFYMLSVAVLVLCLPSAKAKPLHVFTIASASPALLWCLMTGQTTAIALLLWTLAFFVMKQARPFRSGFMLGILAYRFQYLIVLAPVLLLKRHWASLLGLATSLLVLIVAGATFFSPQSYADYIGTLRAFSERIADKHVPFHQYVSLYGFFRPLLPDGAAIGLTLFTAAPLVFWLATMWRQPLKPQKETFDLQFSMAMTATLLVMPHSLIYDLVLLTLPALLIHENRGRLPAYYKLLLALLYLTPLYSPIIAKSTALNPTQPLLIWLSYEIYRAHQSFQPTSAVTQNRPMKVT